MVLYYCEFCNRNIEISKKKKKVVCINCGHFLITNLIDQEEIQRREQIRTGYCPKCGRDQYGVPLEVMRNDSHLKIKNRKISYFFYGSLIWVIIFVIGLIGASSYSVETYNTIETYYTTLTILASFLGFWLLSTLFFNKKRSKIKKEIKKLDNYIDNLNTQGHTLLCNVCLEPLVLKKSTKED